MGNGTKIKMI